MCDSLFGHIEHNWYALNKNNKIFFRWLHIILIIKKMYNFKDSNKDIWKNIEGISSKYFLIQTRTLKGLVKK